MDLPVFRRGLELVSAQLNKLSEGIRAAQITSVIGGSFTRTPGGTTLVIDQQAAASGTAGGASQYCSFKVTDASYNGTLYVDVQQDKVNGQYPDGMDGTGRYTLQIPNAYLQNPWVGVYLIIEVDEFGQIREPVSAGTMRVQLSDRILNGSSMVQVHLLAEITLSTGIQGRYISNIANSCPLVVVDQNGLCPFEVGDVFANSPTVQIRTGLIEARYPLGMSLRSKTVLAIPNDGEWHAVYCQLTVDSSGNILPDSDAIKFILSNDYLEDTATIQYVLVAEVTTSYLGSGERYISYVQNYCLVPAPQRQTPSGYCNFKVTDVSYPTETKLFVRIQQNKINGRYPQGMTGTGNYDLEIPFNWINGGINWVGIYVIMRVNELGQIHSATDAIKIQLSYRPLENSGANQAVLISEITISRDSENKPYISNIANACPLITVQNNGFCAFEISDRFKESIIDPPSIQIQNNKIEARTPSGMTAGGIYSLEIPADGEWHAVYCVLAVSETGNILPGESSISFALFNYWQENTPYVQYVLIGEVTTSYDGFGIRYVSHVENYCLIPAPIRSDLNTCRFRLTDASVGSMLKVKISNASILLPGGDRFPDDMGPEGAGVELEVPTTGYIYLVAIWDLEDYTINNGTGKLFFEFQNQIKPNTDTKQYNLVGTVKVDTGLITDIYSVCFASAITPCSLSLPDGIIGGPI